MLFISILILLVVFVTIYSEMRYFKNQKKKVQKYPFYDLRDNIILSIAKSEDHKKYMKMYDKVNSIIENLNIFNFSFYSYTISEVLNDFLEEAYKDDLNVNENVYNQFDQKKLDPFEEDFIKLILKTAKQNSLLLRLSMTKIGFRILITSQSIKAVINFFKNHPEILKKKREQIKTARSYSFLNQLIPQT